MSNDVLICDHGVQQPAATDGLTDGRWPNVRTQWIIEKNEWWQKRKKKKEQCQTGFDCGVLIFIKYYAQFCHLLGDTI